MGGINSGKTYYLLCLVHILLGNDPDVQVLKRRYGIADVRIVDPTSQDLYDQLIRQASRGDLPYTDSEKPLGFFSLILTMDDDRVFEFVLFNTSGEKLENEYEAQKFKTDSHEMKGAATVYLVDPREDSLLNRALEYPKDAPCRNQDIGNHIYRIMQIVNGHIKIIRNPLAVCISKFDLLEHRIPLEVPFNPYIEAHNRRFFEEIQTVSDKLNSFLQTKSETVNPGQLEERFRNVNYFALAPFGSDERPAYWDQRKPQGILAPFFWVLKKRDIIKDENGSY